MPNPNIRIESVAFNFDLHGNSNAVPLFDNHGKTFITAPEWKRSHPQKINPAAFVIDQEIQLKASFYIQDLDAIDLADGGAMEIWAEGEIVRVNPRRIHLADHPPLGNDALHELLFSFSHVFRHVGIIEPELDWKVKILSSQQVYSVGKTHHRFFLLLDTPKAPMHFPNWVQVLEQVCDWASGERRKKEVVLAISKGLKKNYRFSSSGISSLIDSQISHGNLTNSLFLQAFLELVKNLKPNQSIQVECFDIAYLLAAHLRAMGIQADIVWIDAMMPLRNLIEIGSRVRLNYAYATHCLVQVSGLWYDAFINLILDSYREPFGLKPEEYLDAVIKKDQSKDEISKSVTNISEFFIQYDSPTLLMIKTKRPGSMIQAKHSFVKNIPQGWNKLYSEGSLMVKVYASEDHDSKAFTVVFPNHAHFYANDVGHSMEWELSYSSPVIPNKVINNLLISIKPEKANIGMTAMLNLELSSIQGNLRNNSIPNFPALTTARGMSNYVIYSLENRTDEGYSNILEFTALKGNIIKLNNLKFAIILPTGPTKNIYYARIKKNREVSHYKHLLG